MIRGSLHGCFQTECVSINLMGEHLGVYSNVPVFLRVPYPVWTFLVIPFSVDRDLE